MKKRQIIDINEINKRTVLIMELIEKNMFDEASNMLESLPEITEIRCSKKLEYIEKLIEEKKFLYNLNSSKKGLKISIYLQKIKQAIENKKYDVALNTSIEAHKRTKYPLFMYYMGLCYFKLDELVFAAEKFILYKTLGTMKIKESNDYLIQIYDIFVDDFDEKYIKSMTNKRSQWYLDKRNSFVSENKLIEEVEEGKLYIFEQPPKQKQSKVKIELEDEEIKELINNGKINSVVEIFENEEEYNRKITIIALLYINGFSTTADKLLSKNRKVIKENCPNELKLLEKNKKLYIAKSK